MEKTCELMPTPIVVDLDDTLAKTDFFFESLLIFIKQNPLNLFRALVWLLRNDRAYMKTRIAQAVDIEIAKIPFNKPLVNWLKNKQQMGHQIILATATPRKYADGVANQLGFFNQVLATDEDFNLKGANKEKKLIELYGSRGFSYVGDSRADLLVWRSAESAVFVGDSRQLREDLKKVTRLEHEFPRACAKHVWFRAIRIHQWVKNLLLFVPLLTSHNLTDTGKLGLVTTAFFAFSLCASSVYILNDLFDLGDDRKHRSKHRRVFACGDMSIVRGGALFSMCLFLSLCLSFIVSFEFLLVICCYFFTTLLYSLYLKSRIMVDIIILAALFTLRIIAGAVSIEVELSFWLLAFSMFIFLSLAIMKRYIELLAIRNTGAGGHKKARGYYVSDIEILSSLGVTSGCLAVLIMAFYVNSPDVIKLYSQPEFLWLVCPLLLFWICRTWLKACRGSVDDDPVTFVIKDSVSWFCTVIVLLIFWLAI